MPKPPVLLFAFANDKDAYLENLKTEEREIRNILSAAHDSGQIEFLSIGNTTADDIFRNVERYKDRLALFHYAGHAGGTQLHLEDEVASAQGLAKLFGMAKRLQLVVLNGCSSKGQVDKLFKAGVKSVVATSAPVDDAKALLFSQEFYRAFAYRSTVESSFEIAIGALQTHGKIKNKDISRELSVLEKGKPEDVLWGLYSRNKSVLGWRLFESSQLPEKTSVPQKPPNEFLMGGTFDAICEFNAFEGNKNLNPATLKLKKREHLVNSLPSVIGQQVSVLFTPELSKKGTERLRQIIVIYYRLIRFLSAIAISDLWDNLSGEKKLEIASETRFLLSSFIEYGKEESFRFPYFLLLEEINKVFLKNKLVFFVEELTSVIQSFSEKKEMHGVHLFFTDLLQKEFSTISSAEAETLSNDGEYYLSLLLQSFAFLCGYFVSSNKRIHIQKIHFQTGIFKHELRVLYGNEFAEDEEMSR